MNKKNDSEKKKKKKKRKHEEKHTAQSEEHLSKGNEYREHKDKHTKNPNKTVLFHVIQYLFALFLAAFRFRFFFFLEIFDFIKNKTTCMNSPAVHCTVRDKQNTSSVRQ